MVANSWPQIWVFRSKFEQCTLQNQHFAASGVVYPPRKIKYFSHDVKSKYFDYLKFHCANSITADLFVALV